jgi:hypothetical protein
MQVTNEYIIAISKNNNHIISATSHIDQQRNRNKTSITPFKNFSFQLVVKEIYTKITKSSPTCDLDIYKSALGAAPANPAEDAS